LSQARVRVIVTIARCGVYMSDIDVGPIVKAAPRIWSHIGIADHRCASGEQRRQTNNSQSKSNLIHRSLSVGWLWAVRDPAGDLQHIRWLIPCRKRREMPMRACHLI